MDAENKITAEVFYTDSALTSTPVHFTVTSGQGSVISPDAQDIIDPQAIIPLDEGNDQDQELFTNILEGSSGDDTINLGAVDLGANSGSGNDRLVGNNYDNPLNGGAGDDTILGNGGNDRITITNGNRNTIDGGDGIDTVIYPGVTKPDTVPIAAIGANAVTVNFSDILTDVEFVQYEDARVSTFTKEVTPIIEVDTVSITEGNSGDSVAQLTFNLDTIAPVDVVFDYTTEDGSATAGEDYTATSGQVIVAAGETSATVDVQITGDGEAENDETLSLNLSAASGATFDNDLTESVVTLTIENDDEEVGGGELEDEFVSISGDESDNNLVGSAEDEIILGFGGNDTLAGQAGIDLILGGTGSDTIKGGADEDYLSGDEGDDNLSGQGGNDTIDGGAGSDRLLETGNVNYKLSNTKLTGLGTDTISNVELVRLQGGADDNVINAIDVTAMNVTLDGGAGDDLMIGGAKSDFLMGRDGNDTIKGRLGDDGVYGQNGNDDLIGQDGDDTLSGGTGIDRIVETANVNFTLSDTQLKGLGTDTIRNVEQTRLEGGAGNNRIDAGQVNNLNVTLVGAAGNDSLYSGAKADVLYGQDGNDRLESRLGNDVLHGGNGNDAMFAGSGNDTLFGGGGNDILKGEGGNDILDGGIGVDRIVETANVNFTLTNTQLKGLGTDTIRNVEQARLEGGAGNNRIDAGQVNNLNVTLVGAAGNDSLYGGAKADVLYGQDGNDRLESRLGNDFLYGGNGNDAMFAGSGNDTINGNGGIDILKGEGGNDILDGGTGVDRLVETANVNFTLTNTQLKGLGTDTIRNVEQARLEGGAGNNRIDAGQVNNLNVTLVGGAGNDSLYSGAKADVLYGQDGNDRLESRLGNDILNAGNGNDALFAGSGNDTLFGGNDNDVLKGEGGNDTIDGGAGSDRLIETANVDFTLTDTQLTGLGTDTIRNVEQARLEGGVGNNKINAGQANNLNVTLVGGAGNDSLYSGAKADVLYGQDGNDRLEARQGNDIIEGGTGNDTLFAGSGNDRLFSNAGDDILRGESGNDTLNGGGGIDQIIESADVNFVLTNSQLTGLGTDTLGNIESARLIGGAGNNKIDATSATTIQTTLVGNAGNDTLMGSQMSDILNGGAGNDRLIGNLGNDTLVGNGGADTFALEPVAGTDTISDFQNGVDRFSLSASISFSDLSIADNVGSTATLITDTTNNNELLAIVNGVNANAIDSADFTTI